VPNTCDKPWKDFKAQLGTPHRTGNARTLAPDKTRQGCARERILKPAGYFFVRQVFCGAGPGRKFVEATTKRRLGKPATTHAQQAGRLASG